MATNLEGRVVVVTGGNAGIGLGIAEGCARSGADIAIWSRRADKNEEAAERLRAHGIRATTATCDVSQEHEIAEAARKTILDLGRIDACVASAGLGGYSKPLPEVSLETWRSVTSVNLDGVFLAFREAARHLIEQGQGGALVAVSSTSAV